jgi:hypothetical protein
MIVAPVTFALATLAFAALALAKLEGEKTLMSL